MNLLRFIASGSVDDGKSTLIGRLLFDSKGLYEDQLASVAKASGEHVNLAWITDGLRAERARGVTIDVAYRYFSTPKRRFIIADTPGHAEYTRNMATGASTADLAIVLIDARDGVKPQSLLHASIAYLLGIGRIVVAVNKMDALAFDQSVFEKIQSHFSAELARLGAPPAIFIPISARDGDNVVRASERCPWYRGPALLEYLEEVAIDEEGREALPARFPVQYVIRAEPGFTGYAGQLAGGVLRAGDPVIALPSMRPSTIDRIVTFDGEPGIARAGQSVTLCCALPEELPRGAMLVPPDALPSISNRFRATAVWMNPRALEPGRPYLLKHTTQTVTAVHEGAPLSLNEIGELSLETSQPLFFDAYATNRATGAFILIDPSSAETVAAGMIR